VARLADPRALPGHAVRHRRRIGVGDRGLLAGLPHHADGL